VNLSANQNDSLFRSVQNATRWWPLLVRTVEMQQKLRPNIHLLEVKSFTCI